ncbi:transaldolase [Thorsellia anophelis]|nr:transaldolase [Thorsellia anophelis]
MNQLDQLKQFSTVVVDSGDLEEIKQYQATDATTNPSIILNTLKNEKYTHFLDSSIEYAKTHVKTLEQQIKLASLKVAVDIGKELLTIVPGFVSTEVDARASFDIEQSIRIAEQIIELYDKENVDTSRVLIKLAATWQGIKAAGILEQKGIKTNLTLIFSKAQAIAAADSGAFLISPFVGRITDWYTKNNLLESGRDPGVESVKEIYTLFKSQNIPTIVMGASFRNTAQILSLSGCDRLTISPALLEKLKQSHHPIVQILNSNFINKTKRNSKMIESDFYWEHNSSEMAVAKLSEGIRGFAKDQITMESLLLSKLNQSN